ncbi:MAG: adenylate/guanylate cyclase domain-containing protein [Hyphomicrobiaceae bacterium]|nr:adenylate/guanylate cyclase domain-containing protein [Hyphomicrobiaceae bacterium]
MSDISAAEAWLEAADGQQWLLETNCPIGRSPSNRVVLGDPKVSRRHAVVHRQDVDEFWLVDLGSGNGSYVNGRRISLPVRLNPNDVIGIGDTALTFFKNSVDRTIARSKAASMTLIEVKSFECWMLLADIVGSTRLAGEHDPEEWAKMVGSWAAECRQIVELHGGIINKYLGDGFLAIWPSSFQPEHHVASALQAFAKLQAKSSLPFRIVMHVGGLSSGGSRTGEDSLSGIELILLFRMEKLAGTLGQRFLCSEAVHERLAPHVPLQSIGSHEVAGFIDTAPRQFFTRKP